MLSLEANKLVAAIMFSFFGVFFGGEWGRENIRQKKTERATLLKLTNL